MNKWTKKEMSEWICMVMPPPIFDNDQASSWRCQIWLAVIEATNLSLRQMEKGSGGRWVSSTSTNDRQQTDSQPQRLSLCRSSVLFHKHYKSGHRDLWPVLVARVHEMTSLVNAWVTKWKPIGSTLLAWWESNSLSSPQLMGQLDPCQRWLDNRVGWNEEVLMPA